MNQMNPNLLLQKQLHTETTYTHAHRQMHGSKPAMYRFLYAAHGLFPLFLLRVLLALPLLLQAGEGHDLPVLLLHLLPLLLLPVLPRLLELTDVLLRLLAFVHLPLQLSATPQPASWQRQEWVLHCSQCHGNGRNGFYTAASIMATTGMGFTLQPASWQTQEWVYTQLTMTAI